MASVNIDTHMNNNTMNNNRNNNTVNMQPQEQQHYEQPQEKQHYDQPQEQQFYEQQQEPAPNSVGASEPLGQNEDYKVRLIIGGPTAAGRGTNQLNAVQVGAGASQNSP